MVRPMVPEDDLYARLQLPADASAEAIEIAWRSLLRLHHPDVAGDGAAALERTKRINVAHDWLSDPELRARYDRERIGTTATPGSPPGTGRRHAWTTPRSADAAPRPAPRPRGDRIFAGDPALRVGTFLDRVGRLTTDELDRLAMAERQPIAFAATIRRFVPPALTEELERVELAVADLVGPGRWTDLAIREALSGVATELVLGPFLDENLSSAFRHRARDRLIRTWEAALDQPRYGPNTADVVALRDRAARLTPPEATRLVRTSAAVRAADRPWPRSLDREEHEGLRVSAALAERDVQAAPDLEGLSATATSRVTSLLGRLGHVTALRHALPQGLVAASLVGWRQAIGGVTAEEPAAARTGVRHGRGPRVRRQAG